MVRTVTVEGAAYTIPECVAAILARRETGSLGEYVPLDPVACGVEPSRKDMARVTAGGLTFIAWRDEPNGPWSITFKASRGTDPSAEVACRTALGLGSGYSASKH